MPLTSRAAHTAAVAAIAMAAAAFAAADRPRSLLVDRAYLDTVRARAASGDPEIRAAIAALEADARKALAIPPLSVMDKSSTPPSGDKHDYMSQAPYWWPDPSKPDGKPYIRKDGQRNPEIGRITDRDHLGRLGEAVATLGLAFAYTGREEYAAHAARLTRVWFLDPATRMNPHLRYGQAIPGRCEGRGIGIIDTARLPELLEAVALLAGSPAWTAADQAGLDAWMAAYLAWLRDSGLGRDEAREHNNHGTWYDAQVAYLLLHGGDAAAAAELLAGVPERRIAAQVAADGSLPHELARTLSRSYVRFDLKAFAVLARLGERVGLDLWRAEAGGRALGAAFAWLLPFELGERPWTWQQIKPADPAGAALVLRLAAQAYGDARFEAALARAPGAAALALQLVHPATLAAPTG